MNYRQNLTVTAIGLLLMGTWIPLAAQVQSSESSDDADAFVLEEILVIAQRRSERLQDVPISVTALNAEFIVDSGINNIEELSGFVPGLYTTNNVNYGAAPISIRGIGGANGGGNFFNDEPVGVYLNDMYIGRLSFSTSDLVDVESIQVLRGPQGTLFGRNATAGALLLQTARPTEDIEGFLRFKVAEYGEQRVAAALSGALGQKVQGRLAVGYSNRDGWGTNQVDGSDVNGLEDVTVRASLAFQPSDVFSVDVMIERQDQETNPATINVAPVAPQTPSSPFIRRADLDNDINNDNFSLNDRSENETEATNVVASANWILGPVTLTSVTGYRDYNLVGFQDSDSTEFQLFNNNGAVDSEQLSQEFRLSSNSDGKLSWAVGVYYFKEDASMFFNINNFQGLFGAGTNATFDANQSLESWAVFADFSYALTDSFSLTLGGRYSKEDKSFSNDLTVLTIQDSIPLPVPIGPFLKGSKIPGGIVFSDPPVFLGDADFDNFSPRVVLDYRFNENIFGYVSFSQGFKSGGFNSFGLAPAFEDEEVDAIEVGIKNTLLNRRLRLNVALFTYGYKNLQVRLPVPTGGVTIQNAGAADVSGFEIEASLQATDRLRFDANLSVLDTELTEFNTEQVPESLLYAIGAPIPLKAVNAAGNELTRAPKLSYFLSGTYSLPIGQSHAADIRIAYRYRDEVFFLETNQTQTTYKSDSSSQLDLRFTLRPGDARWEGSLFLLNATDDRSITQVTALGSYPNAALNAPRQWGAEFIYRWN